MHLEVQRNRGKVAEHFDKNVGLYVDQYAESYALFKARFCAAAADAVEAARSILAGSPDEHALKLGSRRPPLWDGHTAERIVRVFTKQPLFGWGLGLS